MGENEEDTIALAASLAERHVTRLDAESTLDLFPESTPLVILSGFISLAMEHRIAKTHLLTVTYYLRL